MPSNVCQETFIIRPDGDMLTQQAGLQQAANALAIKYAFKELVTEEELKHIGQGLWQALELEDDFARARQRAGAKILPIIVESDNAAIQQLPWETLYHPEQGFLGKSPGFALSRQFHTATAAQGKLETGPLRVLLFTSLPDDLDAGTGRLDVEEEQARVQEALMPWIAEGTIKLEMPDDGRFSTLKLLLKGFDPHLLFLSGHGKFHHEPHSGQAPYGTFLFESEESGDSEPVCDTEIAQALIGSHVQCVVVSACESGKSASDALSNGLARQLIQKGIAHVIGMRESMLDRSGTQFARYFCDAMARRERIDVALQQARLAITTPLKGIARRQDDAGGLGELSLGQWCLPMLIQQDPRMQVIDWDFTPQPPVKPINQSLKSISLPPRFIGRRAELRQLKSRINRGQLRQLLITGPGGQGKTALAGKIAQDLQQRGYEILAWSARATTTWHDYLFELELQLTADNAKRYDRMVVRCDTETQKAELLLRLLLNQTEHGLVLLFDNLESIQQPDTLELDDPLIQAWITAAQGFCDSGLILVLTSRWQIPGWPDQDHWSLAHARYGDFLQMAQQQSIAPEFYRDRSRLRQVHATLYGNGRGLAFFAAAIKDMDLAQEQAFLVKLAQAEEEIQADMALELIFKNLGADELELLQRLPAFQTPVPMEGIIKLALDMAQETEKLLKRLVAASLVEKQFDHIWQAHQYQLSPLVAEWMQKKGMPALDRQMLCTAAEYQKYLFRNERHTLPQAITVHKALRLAGEKDEADRLALDFIVGELSLQGFYNTLLNEWLPDICKSDDSKIQGKALGQTGKQYLHLGDYDQALEYLKQSLDICQQIGDKAGQGTTLNNISQVYKARGDYDKALEYLKQSLAIRQQIGDKAGEGTTLNNISQVYDARGDYDQAFEYLKQSLDICQQIGDKAGQGAILNNISHFYKARGDYDKALEYLKQSLDISQQIGNKAGEGATLSNISQVYYARGDYDKAFEYLKQSLNICQQIGDKAGEGAILNNISQVYDARGDYDQALEYLNQSLSIRQQIGDKAGQGTTLNNISTVYDARGDYDQALKYLKQSLAIYQQIGDKAGEGATLNNISQVYDARGDYDKALEYLKQSLSIRQQIGDSSGLCATLFNIGHIHFQKEEKSQAVQTWVAVYRLAKTMNLAQILDALENLAEHLNLPGGLDGWETLSKQVEGDGR